MPTSALSLNYIRSRKKKAQRSQVGWHKPPEGVYMVNMDASFNHQTHVANSGVVIRDSNGGFVAARCFRIERATNVRMIEATAARDGVWFCSANGALQGYSSV